MKKLLALLGICLALYSCNNSSQNSKGQETLSKDNSRVGWNNFAVVWDWSTNDSTLVAENAVTFTKELLKLWENSLIENVYLDTELKTDEEMQFPSISFFIKAHSKSEAESILDSLTIVRKEFAHYTLFPVGMLWLGQNQDSRLTNMNHTSFVTIWETKDLKPVDELTKAQNDAILALWESGTIENVYFDLEGVSSENEKTDFVFYIKAADRNEAESICKSLPFYKEELASYSLFKAGAFWLGINDDNTQTEAK